MENLPNFQLHRPTDIEAAVRLGADNPEARYLAGGTDLVVNMRRGIERPDTVIDLAGIAALREMSSDKDGVHIGAAVSLRELAGAKPIATAYPAVAAAAAAVAGPTHQVYGTLGGNLCLDTRCLYYNQSEWWRSANAYCLKHRGEVCHVAPGGKRCFAAFSGDVAPAMLIFDAEAELAGPEGGRRIPLAELYNDDGMNHLALAPGELLVRVHLPKVGKNVRSTYEKARIRGSIDFPLSGAAVRLEMQNGKVKDLRIAVTAVNPSPHLITGTDAFAGRALDDAALEKLRGLVQKQSKPMATTTVKPWYRRRVTGALARRLALRLAESA